MQFFLSQECQKYFQNIKEEGREEREKRSKGVELIVKHIRIYKQPPEFTKR
jgi:hypothetical protein